MCWYKYINVKVSCFLHHLGFFWLFNFAVILYLLLRCFYFAIVCIPTLIGGISED